MSSTDVRKPFLVVTGSSAGGIEALSLLATSLPPSFAAPIVIAQHLAPKHNSQLAAILRAKTALPVVTVADRVALSPGTIYVVGPDHDVEISDDHAQTFIVARSGPKPSIDRLFATAAESFEDRCIAIIFSGMGSDGTAGARVVKEHGGTVIVQEPSSAPYPAMPLAIPPTSIDLVARPEAMGAMLVSLIAGVFEAPETPSDQQLLRTVLLQLRERSGVDFTQYKTPTILRRLSRLMVAAGVASIADYLRYLQLHPEGFTRLVSAFLIKVTEFFRDGALYDELRASVLPRLIEYARSHGGELRMWSAGTSTGEEAYSLAILCAELLRDDEGEPVDVRIFATDLDDEAIAFARRGVYPAESVRQLPEVWIERYFVRVDGGFEVTKRIRSMTVFGQHDLGQRAPFPRIDLCLCRNVLIYFTRDLQMRALQLFAFSLRDGGYLVIGKAESTAALADYFRTVNPTLKIFQREGARILIPPTRIREATPNADARASLERSLPALQAVAARPAEARLSASETFGSFLAHSPVGVAVVDRQYDIIGINVAARAMLEIHGVGIGEDLIHLVRGFDATALRELIDAAFRNEAPPLREFAVRDASGQLEKWLHVAASPDRIAPGTRSDVVAVVIVDATAEIRRRRELEVTATTSDTRIAALLNHVEDLERRHKALLAANEELTLANNDLRSLNEQLLIGSEEAASANEEIETLNEEMQATNEELETLNEELQATVEELNTTNDELESRGAELERLGDVRETVLERVEAERTLLGRGLDAVGGPLAVVGESGAVLYASPALGGRAALGGLGGEWWRAPTVPIDGAAYRPQIAGETPDGLRVVSLTRVS